MLTFRKTDKQVAHLEIEQVVDGIIEDKGEESTMMTTHSITALKS